MDTVYAFAPITKSLVGDDGSRLVYGKITGPDLDLDLQRMDPAWLAKAVPDWFKVGNIREMHQPKAVGKALELSQDGDDYYISAKIVDKDAIAKLDADVYTGFSIGVKSPVLTKSPTAPMGLVTGGKIIETSLADIPTNPTATLLLAKAASPDDPTLVATAAVSTDPAAEPAGEDEDEVVEISIVATVRKLLTQWLASEAGEAATSGGSTLVVRYITWLIDDLDWAAQLDAMDDLDQAAAELDARISPPVIIDPEEPDVITLSAMADLVKSANADDAPETAKAAKAELLDALGLTNIDATLTKAIAAEGALTGFEQRIAKVEQMAAPGGPARLAFEAEATKSAARDAHLAEADRLNGLASTVTDPTAKRGYADAASAELAKAAQI